MKPKAFASWLVATLVAAAQGQAQPVSPIPDWAQPGWQKLSAQKSLEVSARMKPATLAGDFDGDGKPDLAVFVRHKASGKEGIAWLFGAAKDAVVVGAGRSFGNGGDDFAWADVWRVKAQGKAPRAAADSLFIAKSESASALIVLRSGRPVWQQHGD